MTQVLGAIPRDLADRDVGELENDVQLISLQDGNYCLNHALRQRQVYGGSKLRDAVNGLRSGLTLRDNRLRSVLLAEGFLVEAGNDKNAFRAELAERESARVDGDVDFTLLRVLLTDFCNLKCDYCKVVQNVAAPQKAPTGLERLTEVVEYFFANSTAERPKIIHCTGGEPTLHWSEVEHLLNEKHRLSRPGENCWVVIGTNATLITSARAKLLADHNVKCIVSMDGTEEVHDLLRPNHANRGSWKQVDRGIRLLKDAGVEVSISAVFGKHNLPIAEQIIEYFMEQYAPTGMGVNFMKPPTPEQRDYAYLIEGEDYAETLYRIHQTWRDRGLFLELVHRKLDPFVSRQYRFHDCGAAGGANINLDAKGKVGPCKSFLVMDRLAIDDLDGSDYSENVLSKWRKRSPIYYDHCDGCAARGMCGNGCAYDAYVNHGDEMAIDDRSCRYTKRFNELMIQDLFELAGGAARAERETWFVVTDAERRRVMGNVGAIPNSLSYSIGHHSND
ncbi:MULTISPECIES: radical SAM/SPASM domain-containing protein [Nocardia]|uniref:radical SAM/SPASM domain-containing protein n=1 Tax=Nocardia TaxID=1817 RepID=UPI002E2D1806|nr:radical SAM protein [Nocardia salmonicida]